MRRNPISNAGMPRALARTLTLGRWRVRVAALGTGCLLVLLSVTVLYAQMVRPDPGKHPSDQESTAETHASKTVLTSLLGSAATRLNMGPDATTSGLSNSSLSPDGWRQMRPLLGQAEGRLIEIYQLIGQADHRMALRKAESLVKDHPNFHLAQLVLGDLLNMQARAVNQLGDIEKVQAGAAAQQLAVLREESRRRMLALTQRPPQGFVPTQFLALSRQSRHAIAVDASRSRLYLFENLAPTNGPASAPRLRLISDFYISVGLLGINKSVEGDKRTPLGVYYITSNLKPDDLPDLYGVGALPINYPNALDTQRGKTGSGIWLHGTPKEQFVRAPQASDGCVVLANPDLERLLGTVQIRTTPVVIASELKWVDPVTLEQERQPFEAALNSWRVAKSQADPRQLKAFYSARFNQQGRSLAQWWPKVESELRAAGPRDRQLKDLSMLRWQDTQDTMVVTFGEVVAGSSRGVTLRQYWMREGDQWKIFYESSI